MIDSKVRAIYQLMLNDQIFATNPSDGCGSYVNTYVNTYDLEVVKEITCCIPETVSALELVKILVSKLLLGN